MDYQILEERALALLSELGAVLTNNHFVYTSGLHGRVYVNKDIVYPHTDKTAELCQLLTCLFHDDEVDVIVAPALGGIALSQWSAYYATDTYGHEVLGVYAERAEDSLLKPSEHKVVIVYGMKGRYLMPDEELVVKKDAFQLRRGYDKLVAGRRVRIVEDILTTGGSVRKVVEAVRLAGGNVTSIGALCNRGNVTAEMVGNVPILRSLVNLSLETWTEEECAIHGPCSEHVPVHPFIGKGTAYLSRRSAA